MFKNSKKWMIFLGIPAILCSSVLAFGGCKGHGVHGKGFMSPERIQKLIDWKLDDVMDEIDATASQREQIRDIKDRLVAKGIALHINLAPNHVAMHEQWKSDSPDMDFINDTIDDAAVQKTIFAKAVAEAIVELHSVLTPEQRDQISEFIEKHHADHAKRFLK